MLQLKPKTVSFFARMVRVSVGSIPVVFTLGDEVHRFTTKNLADAQGQIGSAAMAEREVVDCVNGY
jgi:hypothetical protein